MRISQCQKRWKYAGTYHYFCNNIHFLEEAEAIRLLLNNGFLLSIVTYCLENYNLSLRFFLKHVTIKKAGNVIFETSDEVEQLRSTGVYSFGQCREGVG